MRRIAAISDFCSRVPPDQPLMRFPDTAPALAVARSVPVAGGYLERLPLAFVQTGLADAAEIWSFAGADDHRTGRSLSPYGLTERRFRADGHAAPYGSADLLGHLAATGAPEFLCVWGLGVTEETLLACRGSVILYNSLDVEALRVPVEVSRHVDIFLTASAAQSSAVLARHPQAVVAMLPVGPDFASAETFFPLPCTKEFDIVYVAAAQPYKRHDILFDAMAGLGRPLRALCVIGYGELADALRAQARERQLDVTFTGPPGVPHAEVNRLMNRARLGVVCGAEDGAPAILTEYMLAGLPVLANADLSCGLQYIRPETGRAAPAAGFGPAMVEMLEDTARYTPRETVLRNWTWPHSMARLQPLLAQVQARKRCLA